jgi:hypothetical protein
VAHQLPHRHRPGLRHVARRRRHLELGEFRDVFGDRIVERPLALLVEHHHRDADNRLGHRRNAEDRVAGERFFRFEILDAVGVEGDHLAVARHERGDPGQLGLVDQRPHRLLVRLQPVGREADRLGRGQPVGGVCRDCADEGCRQSERVERALKGSRHVSSGRADALGGWRSNAELGWNGEKFRSSSAGFSGSLLRWKRCEV